MRKKGFFVCFDFLVFALVTFAWLMMFRRGDSTLSAAGFRSLRYFTVLSNLLEGIASLVFAVSLLRGEPSRRVILLKYAAAASVGLTFLTVMLFLGPVFGYGTMFVGANFWLHLVIPLAALAEYCFIEGGGDFTVRQSAVTVVPMLVYGLVYLANILVNGPGEPPYWNDFYGFTMWGMPAAIGIFAALALITWLAALAIRAGNRKIAGVNSKK